MKKIFSLLTAVAAVGFCSVSCTSGNENSESPDSIPQKAADVKFIDVSKMKNSAEFDAGVNAQLDRELAAFNAVDEIKMPLFEKGTDKAEFMALPINKDAAARKAFALSFTAKNRSKVTFLFDKETQTLTVTQDGGQETYEFGGTMKDVPPYPVYMAYAFGVDLTRIAHKVALRAHEAFVPGTNNSGETFLEADEFLVAGVPCICYDIELKPRCAPAESVSLFFDIQQKTPICAVINFKQPQSVEGEPAPDPVPPKVITVEWREHDGTPMPHSIRATDGSFSMQLDEVKFISMEK